MEGQEEGNLPSAQTDDSRMVRVLGEHSFTMAFAFKESQVVHTLEMVESSKSKGRISRGYRGHLQGPNILGAKHQ